MRGRRSGRNPNSGSWRGPRAGFSRSRRPGAEVVRLPTHRRPRRHRVAARRADSSEARTERTVGLRRVQMAVMAVAVVGLLLCGRAIHLSFGNDERYQAFAAEQSSEQKNLDAARGRGGIISADGRELATSLKSVSVVATPYQVEHPRKAAKRLTDLMKPSTGQGAKDIEGKLTQTNGSGSLAGYSLVGKVEPKVAARIQNLGISGITLAPGFDRVYPDGKLASQITGHQGDYGEVFGGIEARYDKTLDRGGDVKLTVDTAVQQELEKSLSSATNKYHAKSALGLVMRVDDGSIVALANYPNYDNNLFSKASPETQRNRVLTDPYEPGSTFKPFTIAAALEKGTLSEDDTFVVPDSIQVADRVIHDSEPHVTEVMSPRNILERSSNVGTIKIAEDLGGQKLDEYIRRFGFGKPTGVDVWGEDPGNVPSYSDWSGSSIGNIPMGQGLTVTPLQLAAGYATLANGGYKITPHVTQNGGSGARGSRVISEDTSAIVRGMLQSVVDTGTGKFAQIPGYTVAGKTGTSQKVDPKTGAYGEKYVSSFVGFAPAKNPKYVTLIAVDEPKDMIWGERVAAPAFQEVMSFTLGYFNVRPDASSKETTQ